LVNCARVLDCPLEDVCEDAWLTWTESFNALGGPWPDAAVPD
jgi:hypothetical protein